MQKTAQQRGFVSKVRETVSPTGKLEEFFDPEFKGIMEKLRRVDDQIRAELTGKQIGDEVPTGVDGKPVADVDDVPNFKKYIKDAEKHLNRKEYMKAFADLARFHSVTEKVHKLVSDFEVEIDTVHERFLFSDLVPDRYEEGSEEYAEYLEELKKKFKKEKKEADRQYTLVIQAGIFDFFSNIGTQRGRALSLWEKRYPKKVKALKAATKSMISSAKSLENNILKILKAMATARATRDVDSYITQAGNLINSFSSFDGKFKSYYDDHIRKFLEKQELFAPTKETEDSEELGDEEVDEVKKEGPGTIPMGPSSGFGDYTPPTTPSPTVTDTFIPSTEPGSEPEPSTSRIAPLSEEFIEEEPLTQRSPMSFAPDTEVSEFDPMRVSIRPEDVPVEERRGIGIGGRSRFTSQQFIESLEVLSSESPLVLAKYITKYAETIKHKEPETYRKLMSIVSSIEV